MRTLAETIRRLAWLLDGGELVALDKLAREVHELAQLQRRASPEVGFRGSVLLIGQTFEARPVYASKCYVLTPGALQLVSLRLMVPVASGAYLIAFGGALLGRVRVGARTSEMGSPEASPLVVLGEAISLGMDVFCELSAP